MIKNYNYKPVKYFCAVFIFTWIFWIAAIFFSRSGTDNETSIVLMLLGLLVPSITTLITVFLSKNAELKNDLKKKATDISRVKPLNILFAIALMGIIIVASILLSLLLGQSLAQLSFADGFSFKVGGISTLLTIILAASLEEMGWRGYAQDAIASRCSWFKATIIFGCVWALWHLPLFFIETTYQYEILQMNPWYMVNFFAGIPPMAILFTWVYLKNSRSIFACMFFHFIVNFLQEKIAMTQITKCVETIVIYITAIVIILTCKKMFFDKSHLD